MLSLARADWTCTVDPACGGALLSLRRHGVDLLRPAPAGGHDVLRTASFPLVPFANRIARGRFAFTGEDVRLPADVETPPHAHHGHGWRRGWQVVEQGMDRVRLALDVAAAEWPWAYRAEQTIRLAGDALRIELAVTNRSDRTMPAGAGIHPYFKRLPQSRIVASAAALWLNDAAGLARERVADDRFQTGMPVTIAALEGIDNFFEGPADVMILGDTVPVRLRGDACAGFHVYVPPGGDFFCVEPVSHAPDSFGRGTFTAQDVVAAGATRKWSFEIAA